MTKTSDIKRRGKYKKLSYYRHNGEEVIGLKRRPNGRFYASEKPTKTFGTDPTLAVHRFRQWQQEQDPPKRIKYKEQQDVSPQALRSWEHFAAKHPDLQVREIYREMLGDTTVTLHDSVLVDSVKDYFRTLILTDAKQAAVELNIPELAYFSQLRPPTTQTTITLIELGEKFCQEKRNKRTGRLLTPKHQLETLKYWNEFLAFTSSRFAGDITHAKIAEYGKYILSELENGKSQAWVKARFISIRAVINFGILRRIDAEILENVIKESKKEMVVPAPPKANPKPITPQNFRKIYNAANVRQQAILITALNLCMKSGEVAALNKNDIDLDKGTVVTERSKTGATRIGVLWAETINAIKTYQQQYPHKGNHLFNSRVGTRLTGKSASRIVIRLRRELGIDESVNFDTIRDGAYTAAIEGGATEIQAKLLAGHTVRMSDQYVRRNPRMVLAACEAIYNKYFPGKS